MHQMTSSTIYKRSDVAIEAICALPIIFILIVVFFIHKSFIILLLLRHLNAMQCICPDSIPAVQAWTNFPPNLIISVMRMLVVLALVIAASSAIPVDFLLPPNPTGQNWAVLVAGSNGWGNYRHQVSVESTLR